MSTTNPEGVTRLLRAWSDGDEAARDRLWSLVYDELRGLAARMLRDERAGHTLQATALVHEAYMRLVDQNGIRWKDRRHFFAIAARVMRRILVDHARKHRSGKRGGDLERRPLTTAGPRVDPRKVDLIALDDALEELAEIDPDKVQIVELRFFAGLSGQEISELLGCSRKTVQRHWAVAKGWLFERMSEAPDET